MNHIEHIQKINSQLDKAREFRYFVLFSCFVLFLDITLTCHNKIPLLSLTYEQIKLTIKPGDFLLFICAYTLYLSFFIPLLRYSVIFTPLGYWINNFPPNSSNHYGEKKDTLSLEDLKRFSILNNNQVALEIYNQEQANIKGNQQLDFYCFSFLISCFINYVVGLSNEGMIIEGFYKFSITENSSIQYFILFSVFSILVIFCFMMGIVRGCGAFHSLQKSIYIKNHGIQSTTLHMPEPTPAKSESRLPSEQGGAKSYKMKKLGSE